MLNANVPFNKNTTPLIHKNDITQSVLTLKSCQVNTDTNLLDRDRELGQPIYQNSQTSTHQKWLRNKCPKRRDSQAQYHMTVSMHASLKLIA